MANDLCKKHSLGYEPLKTIGLSITGKDCVLCLAEENAKLREQLDIAHKLPCALSPYKQLEAENKRLKQDLIDYGRHNEGCSCPCGKEYGCKCGWLEVGQALKENEDEYRTFS